MKMSGSPVKGSLTKDTGDSQFSLALTFMSCSTRHSYISLACYILPDVGNLGLGGAKELKGLQDMNTRAGPCAGDSGAVKAMPEKQKWKV